MQLFKKCLLCLTAVSFAGKSFSQQAVTSKHIRVAADGRLQYVPDSRGNIIPDFSKVGCYQNREPLPRVPVVKTIEAAGDNSQQLIQSAIDEVAKMPVDKSAFRGAILLKKGTYKIPGTINISASGIVLRGEGDETKLIASGKGQRNLIFVNGSGALKKIKVSRQKITDSYVPVGAHSFTVGSAAGLKIGDSIVLFRPGTQRWIEELKMNIIEVRDSNTKQWEPTQFDLEFERIITNIEGNRIFIDNPVVMAMEDRYGGGEIYRCSFRGRIRNVGIEHIFCESDYSSDTDEDHGWDAVHFSKAENSWAQNITSVYFGYSCVDLGKDSRNITVLNCRSLDPKSQITGGRRYSFNNDGQMNLVMNCFASNGRHDYVTGAKVRGPNVFYNCRAENAHADIGPHHRWATGTLYDNIVSDGEINAQDRGNWGTGHGWSGANQVFWNCTASGSAIQSPWVSATNYVIGMKAVKYEGRLKGRPDADWEGTGAKELIPVSLYVAQLKMR